MNESTDNVASLLPLLRSNLNATELLLAKFSSAVRTELVRLTIASPNPVKNAEGIKIAVDTISTMQSDFSRFKSHADMLLALFEHLR